MREALIITYISFLIKKSLFKIIFIFGCTAKSSLLNGLFSICSEQKPLSSCSAQALHCKTREAKASLVKSTGSRALAFQELQRVGSAVSAQ